MLRALSLLVLLTGCDISLSGGSCGQNSIICSPPQRQCGGGSSLLAVSGAVPAEISGDAVATVDSGRRSLTVSMRDDGRDGALYVTLPLSPPPGTYTFGETASARYIPQPNTSLRDAVGTVTVRPGGGLAGDVDLGVLLVEGRPRIRITGTFRAISC